MILALERLAGPGKSLAAEPPDAKEIAGLRRTGLCLKIVGASGFPRDARVIAGRIRFIGAQRAQRRLVAAGEMASVVLSASRESCCNRPAPSGPDQPP